MGAHNESDTKEIEKYFLGYGFEISPNYWEKEVCNSRKRHSMPNEGKGIVGNEFSEYGGKSPQKHSNV